VVASTSGGEPAWDYARVSQSGGQPPYDTGHLRELVGSAITLYEVHPMAGHPVTEEIGAAMLAHTALVQQLADGIDARFDRANPDAFKNAWINVVSQILGVLHGALELAAECRGESITDTWQAIAASLALDDSTGDDED
jgi:hypothetical protein